MRRLILTTALLLILAACGPDTTTAEAPADGGSAGASSTLDAAQDAVDDAAGNGGTGAELPEESDVYGLPDRSIAIVPLEDVFFDTFDGGSIPLSEASDDDILDLLDRIPPIDTPPYISPEEDDWLNPEDPVLGYIADDGQAYAYPHKILNFHEIVNDVFADVPVLISYCPLCNSGVVFDRRPNDLRHDGVLSFGNTSALFDNDLVMIDRQTSSYWWQVPGRAIVGSLAGAELTVLPSVTTTWAQWLADEPDTLLLSRDLGFNINYDRELFVGYADRVNSGDTPFPVTNGVLADNRLVPAAQVIAIEVGEDAVAVPVEELTDELEVEVGGVAHVIVPDGAGGARAFMITEDGSREPAPSRSTFWFAYVASFPAARVVLPG